MVEKAWPHIKVPHPDVFCEGAPIWHPRFGRGTLIYPNPADNTPPAVFRRCGNMENAMMGGVEVSALELVLDPRGCGILARWIRRCNTKLTPIRLELWQWYTIADFAMESYRNACATLCVRTETPENADPVIFLNAMSMYALNALEGLTGGDDV